MNEDFMKLWTQAPTWMKSSLENQFNLMKQFQEQSQNQVNANVSNEYMKEQLELATKLQKDMMDLVKTNPLNALSVFQLIAGYNQTALANHMLFLNSLVKK